MRAVKQAEKIIKKYGGVFLRKAKHGTFYQFENGSRILISGTPRSTGWINSLEKDIHKLLLLEGSVFFIKNTVVEILKKLKTKTKDK